MGRLAIAHQHRIDRVTGFEPTVDENVVGGEVGTIRQQVAWASCILYRAGNDERWQEFYALASALVQGRALKEIRLMYKVASQTVSAWQHRQDS